MEINILTICTGKYTIFFEEFYNSCELNFLKNHKKKYFVFTDGDILDNDNIIKIHQNKLGWPYDTMMRFKMFNSIIDKLSGEYTFFFNVNMKILKDINDDILPGEENDGLVGVVHPGYFNDRNDLFPYERRFESNFYIPYGSGGLYYQGCFNGGRTVDFMNMSISLEDKTNQDLGNGIIPLWHDESALNWYFNNLSPLSLDPGYAYPESSVIPFDKKIIQIDKSRFGGHSSLRS